MAWPFFDRESTIALLERIGKRRVWLMKQAPHRKAWRTSFPEEAYLESIGRASGWELLLRYNGTGTALASTALANSRFHALTWHRNRCWVAAQRARWAADLKARGRQPGPLAQDPAPQDPFANAPIKGTDSSDCHVSKELYRREKGVEGMPLVPLPATGPASARKRVE